MLDVIAQTSAGTDFASLNVGIIRSLRDEMRIAYILLAAWLSYLMASLIFSIHWEQQGRPQRRPYRLYAHVLFKFGQGNSSFSFSSEKSFLWEYL